MLVGIFMCLAVLDALSGAQQTSELAIGGSSENRFIDPNDWSSDGNYQSKGSAGGTPYDNEVSLLGSHSPGNELTKKSIEKKVAEYVTVRRFVNLLLRRAEFEDVAGNIVPLESISSSMSDQLVMSIVVFARPQEIQSLLDFGLKKTSPYLRQIDEILSNLTSTPEPGYVLNRCKHSFQHWMEEVGSMFYQTYAGIDFMVVVYILTVCYIVWTLKLIFNREGSWKSIFFCFLLPSIVWEFSKQLEEEKVKQHADELRLAKIPDHCLGLETQGWWERIFNSKEECHEYHMARMSHSALKVSILKVALVHVEELMGLVVKFIKDLTASSKDDWWITNILMRTVAWLCLTFVVVALIAFVILSRHPIIRWMSSGTQAAPPVNGSRVEAVKDEPKVELKPPPRRRKVQRAALQGRPAVEGGRPKQSEAHSGVDVVDSLSAESLSTGESGDEDVDGGSGCPLAEGPGDEGRGVDHPEEREGKGVGGETPVAHSPPRVKPLEKDGVS